MTFNFDVLRRDTAEAAALPLEGAARVDSEDTRPRRRALLVGQPNVGKSVVFGALTGTYVTVSNYPGTTVEVTRGRARFGEHLWEVIDTPGTHNLVPMSEDEAVTRDLLVSEPHDALVQVGDAKNLSRTLLLTLQLAELGIPFCLDLNMLDEARARGLTIALSDLELELPGLRVSASTATENEGLDAVRDYLGSPGGSGSSAETDVREPLPCAPRFPDDVEAAIADVEAHLEGVHSIAKRAMATMLLGGERGVTGQLVLRAGVEAQRVARERAQELSRRHGVPAFALLSRLRLARAQAIVRKVQHRETQTAPRGYAGRVAWGPSAGAGVTAALVGAMAYDGALARTAHTTATDPLANYSVIDIASRFLSRDLFSHWSAAAMALLVVGSVLGTWLVREHARLRNGSWKLVAAIAAGWTGYWAASMIEGLVFRQYSSLSVHFGAIVGLAATVVALSAGHSRDAALSRAIGRAATHPVWGLGVLAFVLLLAYKVVGVFGAGTAVDFIENRIFGSTVAQTALDAVVPRDALDATDLADDGAKRLIALSGSPSGVLVLAQMKANGVYVADPAAAIDVYAPGAQVSRTSDGVRIVGASPGAQARIWSGYVNRWAFALFTWIGVPLLSAFFVGPYGLLTMGVTYAVAIVLPVVATFFFVFSMLEDSGYLPRLAVMANRGLRSMGLNGRAVLPMVLGLGCDTMATLTARIMETRKERVLVTLLLALGVPCSSQLSVIFALMQRTSHVATLVWLSVVIGTLFGVGWVAARVLPGDTSDFLLEMPPIRQPMVRNLISKTMARLEWYLKEAVPLFLVGTALLFVLDATHLLVFVHRFGEPVVHHILGFRREGGVADRVSEDLLVGFLRRDFGAAGMLDLARAGKLSPADVAVSMVTITLFIPCIANVFMMAKERGWKVAGAMSAFIFPYAIAVGAAVRFGFRVLGG